MERVMGEIKVGDQVYHHAFGPNPGKHIVHTVVALFKTASWDCRDMVIMTPGGNLDLANSIYFERLVADDKPASTTDPDEGRRLHEAALRDDKTRFNMLPRERP